MPKVTIAQARDRERRAVALHLAGMKFDDIAEQVGFASRAGAYECVMRAIRRETSTNVEEIRESELARLDELLMAIWPKARKGDHQAIDRVLKIMERKAKYTGADAPMKVEGKVELVSTDDLASYLQGAYDQFQRNQEKTEA